MAEVVEKYSIECYLAPDNPRFEDIESINNDVIKGFLMKIIIFLMTEKMRLNLL